MKSQLSSFDYNNNKEAKSLPGTLGNVENREKKSNKFNEEIKKTILKEKNNKFQIYARNLTQFNQI